MVDVSQRSRKPKGSSSGGQFDIESTTLHNDTDITPPTLTRDMNNEYLQICRLLTSRGRLLQRDIADYSQEDQQLLQQARTFLRNGRQWADEEPIINFINAIPNGEITDRQFLILHASGFSEHMLRRPDITVSRAQFIFDHMDDQSAMRVSRFAVTHFTNQTPKQVWSMVEQYADTPYNPESERLANNLARNSYWPHANQFAQTWVEHNRGDDYVNGLQYRSNYGRLLAQRTDLTPEIRRKIELLNKVEDCHTDLRVRKISKEEWDQLAASYTGTGAGLFAEQLWRYIDDPSDYSA